MPGRRSDRALREEPGLLAEIYDDVRRVRIPHTHRFTRLWSSRGFKRVIAR